MRTIDISCAPELSFFQWISPHKPYSRNRGTEIPGFCIYAFSLNQGITSSIFSFVLSELFKAEPPFLFCGLTSGEVLSLVEVLFI